jgi:hypothetical protein
VKDQTRWKMPKVTEKSSSAAADSGGGTGPQPGTSREADRPASGQQSSSDEQKSAGPPDSAVKWKQPGLITGLLRAATAQQQAVLRTRPLPADFLGADSDDTDDELDPPHYVGYPGFVDVQEDSDHNQEDDIVAVHDPHLVDPRLVVTGQAPGPQAPASPIVDANPGLLANFIAPQEDTGPDMNPEVAAVVRNAWLTQHRDLAEVFQTYPRPRNSPTFKVDVNEEIMQVIDSKTIRQKDMKLRAAQGAVAGAATTMTNVLSSLTEMEKCPTNEIHTHLTDMVKASVGGLKLLGHANMTLNNYRKNNFKPMISPKYHGLCKDTVTGPSAKLFGEGLGERLRSMAQAAAIGKSVALPRWKVKQHASRYQPYSYGKPWRAATNAGKPEKFSDDMPDVTLNVHSDTTASYSDSFVRAELSSSSATVTQRSKGEQTGQPHQENHLNDGQDSLTQKILQSVCTKSDINVTYWPEYKAGRISECNTRWAVVTSDPIILRHVRGLHISFVDTPMQTVIPRQLKFTDTETSFLNSEIEKLLSLKVIEKAEHSPDEFISQIFLRPKKQEGKFRLILNLKELNEYVEYHHFKMDALENTLNLVTPNSFMMSIDLKDAYYSVNVQHSFRKYLRFEYQGELFQFTCLPNGLSSGPRVFTKLMKVPLSYLRKNHNVNISCYIDDVFISDDSYSKCLENAKKTAQLLQELGFTISEKSVLRPTQIIEHVGFVIDSQKMQISLPSKKVENILKFIEDCLLEDRLTIRQVAQLLGTLEATKPGNRFAMLFTKNLTRAKNKAFAANGYDFDRFMILSDYVRHDLQWWTDNLKEAYNMIYVNQPKYIIFTDASKTGWGCYSEQMDVKTGGKWTPDEAEYHINVLELMAVLNSLKSLCRDLRDTHIRIMTDNTTTMLTIQNQGSVRSKQCNQVVRDIWFWAMDRAVWLSTAHIAGVDNVEADEASRQFSDDTEWTLNSKIFQDICLRFGKPDIDLFASRLNYRVLPFCSWQPDPEAKYVDSFTISWKKLFGYAFPPFSLLSRVLQKVQMEGSSAVVVAPDWPSKPWYTMFQKMMTEPPIIIPVTDCTLFLPSSLHSPPHPLVGRLRLMAAKVTSTEM